MMLNPLRPSISMPVLHTVLLHQYASSPYCSPTSVCQFSILFSYISMPVLHTVFLHQYANSPYCFRQVIHVSYEENLSNNQKLFRVAIFSIILMTLTFDWWVILLVWMLLNLRGKGLNGKSGQDVFSMTCWIRGQIFRFEMTRKKLRKTKRLAQPFKGPCSKKS